MAYSYPDRLPIHPLDRPPCCRIRVPGSKSLTNRALVLAALASGHDNSVATVLTGALRSEDTEVMVECLGQLGIAVNCNWSQGELTIPATGGKILAKEAELFVANSGTTMRFLTALVCLGHGRFRLDGIQRMRERPIADLLTALYQLGVKAYSERNNGCPPVVVEANGLPGGRVVIRGDLSSQFLSGLLMAAPLAQSDIFIEVDVDGPLVSWPYVVMTVELMSQFGAWVNMPVRGQFHVPGGQRYQTRTLAIEPDASAASYFAGAAAITCGEVELPGLTHDSLQGDVAFLAALAKMGCAVEFSPSSLTVRGDTLRGMDIDMNDISDTVMTMAAVACFADGPTTIRNVAHIRHKESDRLSALATELRRAGAEVEEFSDGLTITPRPLHAAEIETYNDHRMAMSMALLGLRVPGIVIKNPGCVAKTYPGFFADLEKLRC
jgi:3-phosphoshikimate 1-carboxyvinyltransferase